MNSHIVRLTASNVKRLKAVTISPDGKMVVVGGKNGAGKSSVLDSIAMVLGGKGEVPQVPVRKGADSAEIIAELDGIVIRRTIGTDGSSALDIREKDEMGKLGPKMASPQSILDKLTGKLTFDPLAFTRLEPRQQGDALRKLVGLDLTEHDAGRKKLFDERTVLNAEIARLRALVNSMPVHKDVPDEVVSVDGIMEELAEAQTLSKKAAELHEAQMDAERSVKSMGRLAESTREVISGIEAEIKRLTASLEKEQVALGQQLDSLVKLTKQAEEAKVAAATITVPDLSTFQQKLKDAQSANAKIAENNARNKVVTDGRAAVEKADSMTRQLAYMDAKRAEIIASAKYPVQGLEFSDGGVVFNGVPLNQASSAEQLRVSVAIAAAMNPQLKVMLVRDGSLLDANGLTLLGELAEKHDLQVWVERVGEGAECSVIIEDGEVQDG